MAVRVIQGREHIAHHLKFLIKGQRQRGLVNMQAQGLAGQVFGHQHHLMFIVGDEQILHCQHIGLSRHVSHGPVSIADLLELGLAGFLILIRVGLINTQPGMTAALTQQVVFGAIFGITIRAAQLLLHLPVTKHQRRALGFSIAGDRLGNLAVETADAIQPVIRNAGFVAEIFQAVLEVGHVRAVDTRLIKYGGVIGGEQYRGMHMGLAQLDQAGIAFTDDTSQYFGMVAKLGKRRMERLPPFGIPLGAIHINIAPRTFDIHQVNRMGREDGDIDLEHLLPLAHLEVMKYQPALGQMIPEKANSLAFRLVCGLADGDDLCH